MNPFNRPLCSHPGCTALSFTKSGLCYYHTLYGEKEGLE